MDFTLHNFQAQMPLAKTKYSSRLFGFYNINLTFENQIGIQESDRISLNSEFGKITNELQSFTKAL